MNAQRINELATQIHNHNVSVGWWDGPQADLRTKLMLVITEVAEATEGERKNLMDDHLPHRKMGVVELADALIRWLDIGGKLGISYPENEFIKHPPVRNTTIFRQHLELSCLVCEFYKWYDQGEEECMESTYERFIDLIFDIGAVQQYDIISAMYEKLEYNKTREDHKLENRMKRGGKKV